MIGRAHTNDINTSQDFQQLWEKLPERASKVQSSQGRNTKFSKFVREQTDLVTDTLFSEECVEKLKEENDKNDKGTYSKAGKRNKNNRSNRSFNNTLNECNDFMKKPLDDCKDFVREKGLYFGCLRLGHISSKCYEKVTCKRCEKKNIHQCCMTRIGNQSQKEEDISIKDR